jgi:hypothetical protein
MVRTKAQTARKSTGGNPFKMTILAKMSVPRKAAKKVPNDLRKGLAEGATIKTKNGRYRPGIVALTQHTQTAHPSPPLPPLTHAPPAPPLPLLPSLPPLPPLPPLRDIRRYQASTEKLIPRAPFMQLFREIAKTVTANDIK